MTNPPSSPPFFFPLPPSPRDPISHCLASDKDELRSSSTQTQEIKGQQTQGQCTLLFQQTLTQDTGRVKQYNLR